MYYVMPSTLFDTSQIMNLNIQKRKQEQYKTILIAVITVIVAIALSFAALSILKIDPKSSTLMSLILSAVTMIILILGIYIGNRLIYKIPFSNQVAPVRKWNWGVYIKSFVIALIVYGIIMSPQQASKTQTQNSNYTQSDTT